MRNNGAPEKRRGDSVIKETDIDISFRVDILDVNPIIRLKRVSAVLEHGQQCISKYGAVDIFVEPVPVLDVVCGDGPVPRVRDAYRTFHRRLLSLLLESERGQSITTRILYAMAKWCGPRGKKPWC